MFGILQRLLSQVPSDTAPQCYTYYSSRRWNLLKRDNLTRFFESKSLKNHLQPFPGEIHAKYTI
jgi:hypothetical protein